MKKHEKLLVKKYYNHLKTCEKKLKIIFRNRLLLLKALTHKSFADSPGSDIVFFNERLEFLGDSILGMIITEYLFMKYRKKDEGFLSGIKSKLIRRETLADLSSRLSLGEMLLLGDNERKMEAQYNLSILENTLEAVIGAYFLDTNLNKTRKFVLRIFKDLLNREIDKLPVYEFKNKLQEYSQAQDGTSPQYTIVATKGPEHKKVFTAEVRLKGILCGKGTGKSKKEAETNAAQEALERILQEKNNKSIKPSNEEPETSS